MSMAWLKIKNELFRKGYNIGFFDDKYLLSSDDVRNKKTKWLHLAGYRSGWFADPFFLDEDNNNYYLLAEEFVFKENRGRLVKITVNKHRFRLKEVKVILELQTHLSFPIIWREDNIVYVYPENYQSGCLSIYSYIKSDDKLKLVKPIILEPLLDTQITKVNNKYYAFGVKWKTNSQEDTKELLIFESPDILGPFTLYQRINNAKKEERGAGQFFVERGQLFRPAQSCEGGYGKAVIVYRMEFKDGCFHEIEEFRMYPNSKKKYGQALHTFNRMGCMVVIDGYDYAHPHAVHFVMWLAKLINDIRVRLSPKKRNRK